MSIKAKRKRALPAQAETEQQKYDTDQWCKAGLRQMRKTGQYDADPEQWHPAARLACLAEDPASSSSLRFLCYKTLLEYVEVPKAAEVRALAGDNADTTIQIIVAPCGRRVKEAAHRKS